MSCGLRRGPTRARRRTTTAIPIRWPAQSGMYGRTSRIGALNVYSVVADARTFVTMRLTARCPPNIARPRNSSITGGAGPARSTSSFSPRRCGSRSAARLRALDQQVLVRLRAVSVLGVQVLDGPASSRTPAPGRALAVEQDASDVDRAHPVDQAMMGLGHQRPAPPASPSSRTDSHSGRLPSSRCERKSAKHSCSSSSPPGAGTSHGHVGGDVEPRRRDPGRPRQVSRARA